MPRGYKGRHPKEVTCYHCNYATKIKSNLKKHIINVHILRRGVLREKFFNCPMCTYATTRMKMIDHYSDEHDVSITKSCHTFLNMDEFRTWKTKVEKDEASRYVVLKGVSKLKTCHVWYYRCHRDGFFSSKGTGQRNIKVKGTNKINGCCPSEMKVIEEKETGKVQVQFVKTHVGHSLDLNRLPLLREDKDRIAEKLALKIPLNKVLDEIQNSKTGDQLERIHLVTRKDVLNIASSYKLNSELIRQRCTEGVCSEIEHWVNAIQLVTNVVRFYKIQGKTCSAYPKLSSADFVFIIFNDIQLEYLKFYGCKTLCIDRTHKRGINDVELTTLLVTDDIRQGFPCAYMLSNRSDTDVASVFVRVVAEHVQCPLLCDTFMCDINDFYYDAWCRAMPVPTHKVFSPWHTERAWRKLLAKVRNVEKRAYACKVVRNIALLKDPQSFGEGYNSSLKELKSDLDTLPFADSFEEEFGHNVSCWVQCFRSDSASLNCTHESILKKIKNVFFQGKKEKRLDSSLWDVMKIVRDTVFDQSIMSFKGALPSDFSQTRRRHNNCMKTLGADVVIEKVETVGWKVHCASQIHEVIEHNLLCKCSLRCEDCRICVHSYRCSCYIATLQWFICDHIHFVASSLNVTDLGEVKTLEENPVRVQVHHISQMHQSSQPVLLPELVQPNQSPQRIQHVSQIAHLPHVMSAQQAHQVQDVRESPSLPQIAARVMQNHNNDHPSHHPQLILNSSHQAQHLSQQGHQTIQKRHSIPSQTHRACQPVQLSAHVLQAHQVLPAPQVLHTAPQVQHAVLQVQHVSQLMPHKSQQSLQLPHLSQHIEHTPQQVHHPSQHIHTVQAQHVSSQTCNRSDDDDDRSMEVLQICETNVVREIEDLIFKQLSKPKEEPDSELRRAKNEALKLVQDIFDAVETKAQLDVFTNAISPVLPTITAMKYTSCTYK